MKKITAAIAILALTAGSALGAQSLPKRKVMTVSTADQFVKAIASNVEIVLKPGVYDLSRAQRKNGANVAWSSDGADAELILKGLSNFVLRGEDTESASVLSVKSPAALVLGFENSKDVSVRSVNLLHAVTGPCSAGVVSVVGGSNVSFEDCLVEGSGSIGFIIDGTKGFAAKGVTVKGCSSGAIDASGASGVSFVECSFLDNQAYPLIMASDSDEILFKYSSFEGNEGSSVVDASSVVTFEACAFSSNAVDEWSTGDEPAIADADTAFEDNSFGEPSNAGGDGLSGTQPLFYSHQGSGLGILYPVTWSLEEDDGSAAFYDEANGVACVFVQVSVLPKGANLAKTAQSVFSSAAAALKQILKTEMAADLSLSAQGKPDGFDYDPYADYAGTILMNKQKFSARARFMVGNGAVWAFLAMGKDADSIGEGSEADQAMWSMGTYGE